MTEEVTVVRNFEKFDEELRIVWGWGSVTTEHGVPLVDLQGDIIETREMQKAVHSFISEVRTAGIMHVRKDDGEPIKIGEIVDSIMFTDEVQKSLGIHLGREGWFVGMRVDDDDVWELVKDGTLKALSIGGKSEVKELE